MAAGITVSGVWRLKMRRLPGIMKCCAKPLTLGVLSAMALTGCATIHTTAMRASGACIAFSPINFSAQSDTRATIAQVRGYNAAWNAICEDQK